MITKTYSLLNAPNDNPIAPIILDFYKALYQTHQSVESIPPNEIIDSWTQNLMRLLFPQQQKSDFKQFAELESAFKTSEAELLKILSATQACKSCNNKKIVSQFFDKLPQLHALLEKDITAIVEGDPAVVSRFEVIRTYPGFLAITYYRFAHLLLSLNTPIIPRILTELAHSKTGIDIHPGAQIGEYFFIDHGTGIVIGETTVIGNRVKLYQGVNLGALSVAKSMRNRKRHPTVEDGVVIYSGASILGGNTIIGENSIIGGNVWLVKSVPPHSKVYHKPAIEVIKQKNAFLNS